MDQLLEKAAHGEAIHFSDLLRNIPSDDILSKLFFNPKHPVNNGISKFGLEVLNLRLEGFKLSEIADKLQASISQVAYWSRRTRNCLLTGVPNYIDIDIPALRRLLHISQTMTGYTKLSELLQELPSDDELCQLDWDRGKLPARSIRGYVTQKDLYILRQRLEGRSYGSICEELGWDRVRLQRHIQTTRMRLIRDLRIELDVPQLFSPFKPRPL